MPAKTRQQTFTRIIGATPVNILPNSPRRKSFLLSPVTQQGNPGVITTLAAVFGVGAAQPWIVPAGVTQVLGMYLWGGGGQAGTPGVALGGGGGGGGGFSTVAPLVVVPGQTWHVTVPLGNGAAGNITNPAAAVVATVTSGALGVVDAGGAGGPDGTGATHVPGGAGASATALAAGVGGGGGGAGGIGAAGNAAPGQAGGAAAGTAGLLGYGVGPAGSSGSIATVNAVAGVPPGGGSGGGGAGGTDAGDNPAGGMAVIVYQQLSGVVLSGTVSMDSYSKIVIGRGSMNWANGVVFPMLVDDSEVGTIVTEEWWIVADRAGVPVTITEYLYVEEQECW